VRANLLHGPHIHINNINMKVAARRSYRMTARAEAAKATGERILSTATEAFLTHPYEQVSLDDVARGAGVTVQTVLRRFGSKEGLVAAAAEVGMERVRADRARAPIGDLAGAVRNLIDHYEEWGARVLRMLAQEEQVPPFRRVTDAGRQLHRGWVERTFAPWLRGSGADRARRLAQLVAVTDVYVWKLLRRDQGLSRSGTERTLLELLQRITGVH
jgi:AcrR family transcriptional regulator